MAEGDVPGQADAVLLAPLTEDTFLHNLHVRYKRDLIYTYVGNALISVNPCRALPLYSAELVRAYLARPPYTLPPHLYAITATAYRWVRDRNESQCIVITGESGAGKTEAARVCLQCAAVAGGAGGGPHGAAGGPGGAGGGALAAAGTLLEAFGNAATTRNHNASRFGKLLEIEFDFKGEPMGGHITHYLLEKERASGAPEGERNFHVLYQLLAGADVHLLKRLRLQRAWEQYRVLRPRPAAPAPSAASPHRPAPDPPLALPPPHAQDRDHFAFTKAAMVTLGFTGAECGAVLRLLAFMLKLGNVQFEPQHNIDGTIGVRIHHHYELVEACSLVGVDAEALGAALSAPPEPPCSPLPHERAYLEEREEGEGAGAGAETDPGEEEVAGLDGCSGDGACAGGDADAEWAGALRDRLVCAVYSRLFTWLMNAVNEAIAARAPARRRTLGILDAYGFERVATNTLDRLLINYAAERVQACLTAATLRREQDEYAREGLAWRPLRYIDHEAHADLLDSGPDSVLGALRDARSDLAFLHRLQRRRHARLAVHTSDLTFQVVHFAGAVRYSARGIVEKNRDAVCRRCAAVLAGARDPLLAALFPPGASPRRPAALACRQRALVAATLRRLASPPRLVRCLRPDAALRPLRFDAPLLRHQIRTQGIMDMALLRRAGWCESMCARALVARYWPLRARDACEGRAPHPLPAPAPPRASPAPRECPLREARALLRALPIPSAEFTYGRTRVFIRSPRTVWELEALRSSRVEQLVVRVQRAWRRYRGRHASARRHRAQLVIARAWRAHRDRALRLARAPLLRHRAARVLWRAWCRSARRRYLCRLWRRLPARHMSPACAAWPPCPAPRLLARTDALVRALHHAWRCRLYRGAFDQTARNRMREKVTASVLFRDRKACYPRSVPHPFVGDYVRLRASGAWRRGVGAHPADRYVVFADIVGKVARGSGRVSRCLAVVSTGALVLLEPRSLRLKRRVPAHAVYRLSLSPHDDDLLVVHVRACAGAGADTLAEEASRDASEVPGCLFGSEGAVRRRGDLLVRTCHVLELATKLFLVVQNAMGAPPHVNIAAEFEANFGQQLVTVSFHLVGGEGGARLVRRGSRMDVLL